MCTGVIRCHHVSVTCAYSLPGFLFRPDPALPDSGCSADYFQSRPTINHMFCVTLLQQSLVGGILLILLILVRTSSKVFKEELTLPLLARILGRIQGCVLIQRRKLTTKCIKSLLSKLGFDLTYSTLV